jgi:hypothetical protein
MQFDEKFKKLNIEFVKDYVHKPPKGPTRKFKQGERIEIPKFAAEHQVRLKNAKFVNDED